MRLSPFLLLLFHFTVISPLYAQSDHINNYLKVNCLNSATSTSNSFDSDLDSLTSSLISNTPQSGYSTWTVGQDGNEIYGAAMCQAGTSDTYCSICLTNATKNITNQCNKKVSATIWYDDCMLRYSNSIFFTSLDDYSDCWKGQNSVPQDQQDKLNSVVNKTMLDLSSKASYNPLKYAVHRVDFNSSVALYELVQCTRNLSNDECYQCLSKFVELLMLSNCSSGLIGGRILGQSCYVRFESVMFFDPSLLSSSTPYSPPPPPPPPPIKGWKLRLLIASIVLVVMLFIIIGVLVTRRLRRKNYTTNEVQDLDDDEISIINPSTRTELVQYSLETLRTATENFSETRKLGFGRFGEVFEGKIDREKVAIKKFIERVEYPIRSQLRDIGKEVYLLAPLVHTNLVQLLGFCIEEGHCVLVYEFVQNGDLRRYLRDDAQRQTLDWETRKRIVREIANGLRYLHYESENKRRIIHCDLKPANILLDERNVVKIADFGLSRILGADKSHETALFGAGTYGYMAPELTTSPKPIYSPEADVYSFGVIVLEIMTKWTAVSDYPIHEIWDCWRRNAQHEMIDSYKLDDCSEEEALQYMLIGLLCVQDDRRKRPDMKTVVQMLCGKAPLPEPSYPGYYWKETLPEKRTWFSRIIKV